MIAFHTRDLDCAANYNYPVTSRASLEGFEWRNLVFVIASHKQITFNDVILTPTPSHRTNYQAIELLQAKQLSILVLQFHRMEFSILRHELYYPNLRKCI